VTKLNQIWKCEVCGNVVEIFHEGVDALVCCEEKMKLVEENVVDADKEKHVPILKDGAVQVGNVLHPMEEKHYIEWIEVVLRSGRIIRKFLKPGDEPILSACCDKVASIRSYCNLHGLWINSNF
jgi:superoxide reductase